MMKPIAFGVVLLSMGSVGCLGGEEEVAPPAHVPDKASQESLIGACEGDYTCEGPGVDPIATTLSRAADGCYAGQLRLFEDGSIHVSDGTSGTWHGTTNEFRICVESDCLVCAPDDGSSPAPPPSSSALPPPEPRCVGSARSCSSFAGGACVQDGCSFQFEVQWDGSLEPDCIGSAKSCSYYDSEGMCTLQEGCRWE